MSRAPSVVVLAVLLAACAVQPPIDATGARHDFSAVDAALAPGSTGQAVIWGGMVVTVRNLRDTSEIEVLAYPLDARQRPQLGQPTLGRFIAVMPGYVEGYDFPEGRFVTLRGKVVGTRAATIDGGPYVFPVVATDAVHLWPRDFRRSKWRVGIGVGVGVR